MRFISVPRKPTDKKVTQELHDVTSSSPCDSGLSLSSVVDVPPTVRRVLSFNSQAELQEPRQVDDSAAISVPVSTEYLCACMCRCV